MQPDNVTKYQFALKNPRLLMQQDQNETSAGTFMKDKDASDLNLGSSRTASHHPFNPAYRVIELGGKARTSSQMQQQREGLEV